MAELHLIGGSFVLRPLGAQGIRRPVLGVRDELEFRVSNMIWDGCGVNTVQELWIDFENSSGVPFRMIATPGSPRGDEERTEPSRVIRRRLEQIPDWELRGNYAEWKKLRNGKRTLLPRENWSFRVRQRLANHIEYGRNEVIILEQGPGRFRRWVVDKIRPSVKEPRESQDVGPAG